MDNANFFRRVYDIVRQIPPGRVTSYGAIARFLGSPQSARMVGWALNNTKTELGDIPAHRVVNHNGFLTGKKAFGGINTMQELLESEGIEIQNDQVIRFQEIFWDPAKELS